MTSKTVIIKNSNISISNTKDTKLSIQFNLDGFSFCITDIVTRETIYFSEYLYDETQINPEDLVLKIDKIFKTDLHLQKDFSSVLVIHQNNLSALVPNEYFVEDKLSEYLNFNVKTLATDFITFDDLECIKAKNIFIPYININNYLFKNYGEFEYKHHTTILIEKLITINKSEEKTLYLNVSKFTFDIIVLENKTLIFSNTFSFQTKEDFIYYILFTFEQLKLDVEKIKLYFTGDIEEESAIYKITYQYIRNVFFLESTNSIFNNLNISKHSNIILLGS
ncbi:DUF3822 family protein [Polaribacter sp. Asnod1-A03]|uniref:DUF3822 family protein n=1 Tax=Polaribacter sp. Asnod1-A03 TaxID=3160581 RepID=UPI00386C22ED